MNYYYNKETNDWSDEKIRVNFLTISKGNFIKTSKYYYKNNKETEHPNVYGYIHIDFGLKKVKTIILNLKIMDIDTSANEISFNLFTCQKDQNFYEIKCNKDGKRQYDGSFSYTIDATNIECYHYVEALTWWGYDYVILNYLTLIYEVNYYFFDYQTYKSDILKEINK